MKLVNRKPLDEFKHKHTDACSQIDAWMAEVGDASWQTPANIKQKHVKASILPKNKVVFDIKGNRYRLLVEVNYKNQIVFVEKIGTHNEYMKWEII